VVKIQTVLAQGTRDVASGLERAFAAMPDDKQGWRPLDQGRSAVHQIAECAVINAWGARVFSELAMPTLDTDLYQNECASLDSAEKALAALRSSTDSLAAAIESVPDDALGIQVHFPWDKNPCSIADAMLMAYWNMTYHIGQINYIQTLYGDKQMH
jgi:hypothetical protein